MPNIHQWWKLKNWPVIHNASYIWPKVPTVWLSALVPLTKLWDSGKSLHHSPKRPINRKTVMEELVDIEAWTFDRQSNRHDWRCKNPIHSTECTCFWHTSWFPLPSFRFKSLRKLPNRPLSCPPKTYSLSLPILSPNCIKWYKSRTS